MSTLPTNLRRQLEEAAKKARNFAKTGARKALEALAVHETDPYNFMNEGQRDLRRKLRAQARQLGDNESLARPGVYEITHLIEKIAYDQWHRILFARFLLENNLLISPEHRVSVTLDDCEELAQSMALKDSWAVAARFASKELPDIFRADDPTGAVELPVEDRSPLIQLVTNLPQEVFTASDSLGWCYQFWQAERKQEVNDSGNKIGADELPAVTQLFTEEYMVDFLLDNTLGAWYAAKLLVSRTLLAETAQSEGELREAVELPGCPWRYLRFVKSEDGRWTPAAGKFEGWPKTAKDLTCLDPCMGSGHFVVAMFERFVALRIAEEELDESTAVASVIRDNVFGLELDPRCTQIAAFNLALAAWRRVGHCTLPSMNLACSGLAPNAKREDWVKLAADNSSLRFPMGALYDLFQKAPVLGSLIDPRRDKAVNYSTKLEDLQPLLEEALAHEIKDDMVHEMVVTARGVAKAAEILAGQFTLVATNVPYLGRGKQSVILQDYCEEVYVQAKSDLATCFVERCLRFCAESGSTALVSPQNWWFSPGYHAFRKNLLSYYEICFLATLGEEAWQSFGDRGPVASLAIASRKRPATSGTIAALDALPRKAIDDKIRELKYGNLTVLSQQSLIANPDSRLAFDEINTNNLLSNLCESWQGLVTSDNPRFMLCFWEAWGNEWVPFISSPTRSRIFGGRENVLFWMNGAGPLHNDSKAHNFPPRSALGRMGVLVSQVRSLAGTIYTGEVFAHGSSPLIPASESILPALWCFVSSPEYRVAVRNIDKKLAVTNSTLLKIEFNLEFWQQVAAEKYPNGLPKPSSSDPTQWLFDGNPKEADQSLHVAIARLLGYQWPRQTGSSFRDCPGLGPDRLEDTADDDGIVCLSTTKGEAPAAERLRSILAQALGRFDLQTLISSAGPKGSKSGSLEDWLRDEFFEQHCEIFHHRPFIWHIWDGYKNGFSALVNYHKLTRANLEKITYAYLGDWLRRQQAAVEAGESGSDARLQAARTLQAKLKLILEGEPPYDIFVRWKPLSKQAIGWEPDINDGIRINIRPFAYADVLRKRVKIKWDKDRGKEPFREKSEFPWFWGWDGEKQNFAGGGHEPDGNRWNGCHYTNEFKKKAREGR